MAGLKELRTRIESIKSTQKITSAMKMVAASSLRKAQGLLVSSASYKDNIEGIVERIVSDMKAQEKEAVEEVPVENEVVTTQAPVKERVSNERISVVDDDANVLKLYNVVVGSFSVRTNASSLKERLKEDGYGAFLARNNQMMYRVIAGSFDTRKEAEELRDAIKLKYSPEFNDAWLLINQ